MARKSSPSPPGKDSSREIEGKIVHDLKLGDFPLTISGAHKIRGL